jgi:hypothetical protein
MHEFDGPKNGQVGELGAGSEVYRNLTTEAPRPAAAPALLDVPGLAEQAADPDVKGTVRYIRQAEAKGDQRSQPEDEVLEQPEALSLKELRAFLQHVSETAHASDSPEDVELAAQATDMLEHLTYIGEREMTAATAQIASAWKQYLDEDPGRQLFMWARALKSSVYVLDQVLGNFSDEELEAYRGRLHFLYDATLPQKRQPVAPTDYKVVMVDDWVGTGRQISEAYSTDVERYWPYDQPPKTEIQLIATTEAMQQDGLVTNNGSHGVHIPVKAIHKARPGTDGQPYITGRHSSTDDRFEVPISKMVQSLQGRHGEPEATMPPLTNVVRPYRDSNYQPSQVLRVAKKYDEVPMSGF